MLAEVEAKLASVASGGPIEPLDVSGRSIIDLTRTSEPQQRPQPVSHQQMLQPEPQQEEAAAAAAAPWQEKPVVPVLQVILH